MTREQIEIALAAKQELLKHLDERFDKLNKISTDFQTAGRLTDSLIIGNRAEVYTALALVCTVDIGTYQGMLLVMQMKEQNNDG